MVLLLLGGFFWCIPLHVFTQDFLKQECAVLKDFEKCKEEWESS